MLQLLKFVDARLGEASTQGGLTALLVLLHISLPPGVLAEITFYLPIVTGLLAIVLQDAGNKPSMAIAQDVLEALASMLKPAPAATPAAPSASGATHLPVLLPFVALVGLLGLSACGSTTAVVSAENALATAETLATQYVKLPACGAPTSPPLCSDAATVAKIKAADNVAYAAVKGFEKGTVSATDAQAAVNGLTALIPPVK